MPSIIGSSLLSGNVITGTGPIGYSGPTGPTGPRGATGTVLGPTGGTAIYIFDVVSNPSANQITFVLSDGNQYGPFSGFTGPTVSYSDSRGLCAEHTSAAYSVWSGISAGITFQFRGITGDGQYITPSLTTDRKELLLTIGNLSAAGTPAYGNTADDFVSYTTPTYTATNTQIKVINQNYEETVSGFAGSADTTALEFGLTGIVGTSASKVRVYSDFETPYITVPSIVRGNPSNPNGYALDLSKSSVFKVNTPVGIQSFSDTGLTNAYKSWLFFIEGSDVWNLPNNLLFDSGITGIGNYGFTPGMNLLRITKSPNSVNYIGTFIDRFIGADDTPLQFGGIGSCCKPDGTCQDYTTQEECAKIPGSYYGALKSCSQSCNIGSCCVNGICYNNINRSTCLDLTGNASAWSGNSCFFGEGGICAPGSFVYQLTNSYTVSNPIILDENEVSSTNSTTWVKIFEFTVKTDDSTAKISIDSQVSSNGVTCLFTLDPTTSVQQKTVANTGTSTVAVYFAGFNTAVPSAADGNTISWNIRLTTSAGSPTSYNTVPNSLTYNNLKIKQKPVLVNTIQAYFKAQRYCLDCYGLKSINNSGGSDGYHMNSQTSVRKYYPIQEQYGTCLFSLNSTNNAINLLSVRVGDVREVNDCKFSDAETQYYGCNTCTGVARPTTKCPHIDYNFDPTTNRSILSNYCKTVRQSIPAEGLAQGYTPRYPGYSGLNAKGDLVDLYSTTSSQVIGATSPYWFDITFNDQHSLISKLSASSVTTDANMKSVLDDLKNKLYGTSNTNGSLFFNKTNFNSELPVVPGNSSCAPGVTAQHADLYNITLDFTPEPAGVGTSYKYFLHTFKTTYAVQCANECQTISGSTDLLRVYTDRTPSPNRQSHLHSDGYYILHKVIVKSSDGNINNTANPGEFLVFPMGSCKDKGFFVRDCIAPKFDCTYTYMDTSTPKYFGEILSTDTQNNKLVVNVSKTVPAELLDTCHTADCLQYMNYQGLTYGLNENQFVSVKCSNTAPTLSSASQAQRLQCQSWVYDYFLAPKICSGSALTTNQWQSTPSGCNPLPSLVPPVHQFDPKTSRFCYNYNQTTTSNKIASYLYTTNSSGATAFQMYYYGWNDASYPNWVIKPTTTTYTNRASLTSYPTSVTNDTTTYPAVFTQIVAQTSNSYAAADTINVPFNKVFWFYTTGVQNALTSPAGSLPTGITAPILIDKFANTGKRNLPEIFFDLTSRVTTTTPISNSYFDFTITPSSEFNCNECLDWELDGRVTTVYLPLVTGNSILHFKEFATPTPYLQLSSFKDINNNSLNTLKFSDFAPSAKDGNDVLLTVNVIQMFYRKNGSETGNQNYKWVEKTRTFRIKYPTSGMVGSINTDTGRPIATQLKRITNLVGDSQCVSINCETSPYLCLSLENC